MALFDFVTSTKRAPAGIAVLSAGEVRRPFFGCEPPYGAPIRVIDGASKTLRRGQQDLDYHQPRCNTGHEGQHVTLTAHVHEDKSDVHVASLKMAK